MAHGRSRIRGGSAILNRNFDYCSLPVPRPYSISRTYQRYSITDAIRSDWRDLARGPGYWGGSFPANRTLRAVTHTGAFAFKRVGVYNSLCARLVPVRCLTDHSLMRHIDYVSSPDNLRPAFATSGNFKPGITSLTGARYRRYLYALRWDDFLAELDSFPLTLEFLRTMPTCVHIRGRTSVKRRWTVKLFGTRPRGPSPYTGGFLCVLILVCSCLNSSSAHTLAYAVGPVGARFLRARARSRDNRPIQKKKERKKTKSTYWRQTP